MAAYATETRGSGSNQTRTARRSAGKNRRALGAGRRRRSCSLRARRWLVVVRWAFLSLCLFAESREHCAAQASCACSGGCTAAVIENWRYDGDESCKTSTAHCALRRPKSAALRRRPRRLLLVSVHASRQPCAGVQSTGRMGSRSGPAQR